MLDLPSASKKIAASVLLVTTPTTSPQPKPDAANKTDCSTKRFGCCCYKVTPPNNFYRKNNPRLGTTQQAFSTLRASETAKHISKQPVQCLLAEGYSVNQGFAVQIALNFALETENVEDK